MLEVPPDLPPPPTLRPDFRQGVPCGGMIRHGEGQFRAGKAPKAGPGFPDLPSAAVRLPETPEIIRQGVVDDAFLGHPAPGNGKIDFVHSIVPEQFRSLPGPFLIRRKEQNPRRGPVQPMKKVEPAARKIPGLLEGEPGLQGIQGRPVDQHARRLVHSQEPWIPVDYGHGSFSFFHHP